MGNRLKGRLWDGGQPAAWDATCVVVDEQVRPEGGNLCLSRLRRGEPHVHEAGSVALDRERVDRRGTFGGKWPKVCRGRSKACGRWAEEGELPWEGTVCQADVAATLWLTQLLSLLFALCYCR